MTAPLAISASRRPKLSIRTLAHVREGHAVFRALNRTRSGTGHHTELACAANTCVALVVDDLRRDLRVRADISAYIKTATSAVQTGTL